MDKLKELRNKNNVTQKQVANDLNIKYTTYNGYERKLAEPNLETLVKLADYFHTTTDYLLEHEVPYLINKSEFSADQLAVIDLVKRLDNEQVKHLIAYIKGLQDGKR